ncbi:MAG: hypothetical protein KIS86_06410 [Devosia sp.]|nr:hypothetical protein [Devosia sp.]
MTTSKEEISALVERVSGLKGPDREVDIEILRLVDPSHFVFTHNPAAVTLDWTDTGSAWKANFSGSGYFSSEPVPKWSGSTDAALALVERVQPGAKVGIDPVFFNETETVLMDAIICIPHWTEWTPISSGWIERYEARHSHLPLAIILALLLSLQSQEPK